MNRLETRTYLVIRLKVMSPVMMHHGHLKSSSLSEVLSVGIRRNKDSFNYYIMRPMSSQADNFITLCFKMSAQNRTLSHVTSCPWDYKHCV